MFYCARIFKIFIQKTEVIFLGFNIKETEDKGNFIQNEDDSQHIMKGFIFDQYRHYAQENMSNNSRKIFWGRR